MEAWKDGLKAIAIYRDGCKRTQPLSTSKTIRAWPRGAQPAPRWRPWPAVGGDGQKGPPAAVRRKLPDERQSHHAQILGGRARGLHPRRPLRDRRAGRDLHPHGQGRFDHLGPHGQLRTAISLAFQHGVPLAAAGRQVHAHEVRPVGLHGEPRDPAGQLDHGLHLPLAGREVREGGARGDRVGDRRQRRPASRVAGGGHGPGHGHAGAGVRAGGRIGERDERSSSKVEVIDATNTEPDFNFIARTDAPTCPECGSIMIPNGSCHKCVNCGTTSGCS